MAPKWSRRDVLVGMTAGGLWAGLGNWAAVQRITPLTAAEAAVSPRTVQFRPEIEPLVRLVETTSRDRIFDVAVDRLSRGLSYRDLISAVFLAGIRDIKPRPVGFKLHAVMAINSAHLLSLTAPVSDRLLPLFWALDAFKHSQAENIRQGGWTLPVVRASALPPATQARARFVEAMDRWDAEAADEAIAALVRAAGATEVIETLWPYAARDWQNIGHKAIFTAQCWRTLQTIGWQHAEPVMRSLVFGLLNPGGPGGRMAVPLAGQPYDANRRRVREVKPGWPAGKPDPAAAEEVLEVIRSGSADDVARRMVAALNRGVAAESLWDAVLLGAGELLMQHPGILGIHTVTSANALHYAFQQSGQDQTRLLVLMQAGGWLTLFRNAMGGSTKTVRIDHLDPVSLPAGGKSAGSAQSIDPVRSVQEIFRLRNRNPILAARTAYTYFERGEGPADLFFDTARRLIFTKGIDPHDYKFGAAMIEEFFLASPRWRAPLGAAAMFNFRGAEEKDAPLMIRAREAVKRLG